MALSQKGLGRGLGALFQDEPALQAPSAATAESTPAQKLPVTSVIPNPKQPRREFNTAELESLAESIKAHGVLQPILVRSIGGSRPPKYEIIAGERRWRASQLAGLKEVPVSIKELSDQETLAIALVENLQREDLNALEESMGILQLKNEFGLSQEDLARTLGKSRSAIANSLRLMNLGPEAQKALKEGQISAGHGRALLALEDAASQNALLKQVIAENLSVRELEGIIALGKNAPATLSEAANGKGNAEASEAANQSNNLNQPEPITKAKSAKALPQSAMLLSLQSEISKSMGVPVKLSGKESKGKISISYSSKEELAALLQRIGVKADF
ncbi:ParB/RepB/Spo0J family partition protein [Desulfovibrio sp. OttesenSCG-928-F07]|nr:ParB/RepB/Spo0J family partition protein [Desulfovibrio sp. OttesenSCG-928-F07]